MKKLLLLIIAVMAINYLSAQTYFGPRLGVNFATMSGQYSKDYETDHGNITGFVIGGVVDHHFSDMISLQGELLFAQKGWKEDMTVSGTENGVSYSGESTEKYVFNTLEIPILVKATFGDDFKFYGNLGPYFNYKMGGKYEYEAKYTVSGYGETISDSEDGDGKIIFDKEPEDYNGDDYYMDPKEENRIDFGLYFGGGVAKQLGPGILTLDLRYGLGFSDFYKDAAFEDDYSKSSDSGRPDGYEAFKNRNFSVTIAYMFGGN